jgi:ATP-dependent Clp protease adaptor protein ClpS
VLHNDAINTIEFVVGALCKVFRYGGGKALWLTLKAHVSGRSVVWSGMLEVAELKAQQLRDCGPDPARPEAPPLTVTIEPLPG